MFKKFFAQKMLKNFLSFVPPLQKVSLHNNKEISGYFPN